eukprot:837991-Karenia_brevis.AAC.1
MKMGPNPQHLLIVRAVAPNHKDLATIQMFKLWTNAGKKQAFSNTTRQLIHGCRGGGLDQGHDWGQ